MSCKHGDCSDEEKFAGPCQWPACDVPGPHAACDARISQLESDLATYRLALFGDHQIRL